MPDVENPAVPAVKRRKARMDFQKRKAQMASIWRSWNEFFTELEAQPEYSKAIHLLSARISQEIAIERNKYDRRLEWDSARNRVLTDEVLLALEDRFEKSFLTVKKDVAKISSHSRWLKSLDGRGEYGMWADVCREQQALVKDPGAPVFAPPAPPPLILKAAEIQKHVDTANAEFQRVQREFLGDPAPPEGTATFGFLADVDRAARYSGTRRKKPRKNWRKEIG